ncbi:hypothetical protein IC229_27470 [Spirosoma sp. BT702]|uniref:Uncharacterized protein n=1 Tax=Spirosoma profusum TaxID=2771354 RepID=A0A927AST4_9BACT|nr:hypothetical protein [Spirosoma profusum]MBD2704411.1 hypothetical protein [Spirosoma profusum]
MGELEPFETALTRVRSGETIRTVVKDNFKNYRGYNKLCTPEQRATITLARVEFLENKKASTLPTPRATPVRFMVETLPERVERVKTYCKERKMTISSFINGLILRELEPPEAKPLPKKKP